MCVPPVGSRVRLIEMPDDPCPVEPGATGTVTRAQKLRGESWQLSVDWDNGRMLHLCIPPDVVEVIE